MLRPMDIKKQTFLTSLFDAAVQAADPRYAMRDVLPDAPKGRTIVIGAGKGAAQMAQALEALWEGPLEGCVVTRYGYGASCEQINVLEAAHPVPDDAGLTASEALLDTVANLTNDDLVIALICGGGSALLPAPPEGCTLEDEQALNRALLASGAPISEMNAIRKHFSKIKGGRLALAAHPARVVSLIVSDVPGDDPAQVASGPTVPCDVTKSTALQIMKDRNIALPDQILQNLIDAPDPNDPRLAKNEIHIIASAKLSLEAAARAARAQGIPAVILSDAIEGEARDIGLMHAALALETARNDRPFVPPVVLLSGGETTVTLGDVRSGRGGRNTEFLLAFAEAISGQPGIAAFAADTDGIDGSEDNAGAFADGTTSAKMTAAGLPPKAAMAAHDAWGAFKAAGSLFAPGPTGTNVNDFRAILVGELKLRQENTSGA